MATAAFKSTTKSTHIGSQEDNSSRSDGRKPADGHRRSRSLSRMSRSSSDISSFLRKIDIESKEEEDIDKLPLSRNLSPLRGSSEMLDPPSVTEIRGSSTQRGRSVPRQQTKSNNDEKLQRGRSVVRHGAPTRTVNPTDEGRRRQRSVSVVRHYQYSDSTSEVCFFLSKC
ncbi:hypothetical protein SUGI_0074340 [Cryptomeria japonica]|nr:hypothetical protein SUGI_0074340 [Cryptomeria japonica]